MDYKIYSRKALNGSLLILIWICAVLDFIALIYTRLHILLFLAIVIEICSHCTILLLLIHYIHISFINIKCFYAVSFFFNIFMLFPIIYP